MTVSVVSPQPEQKVDLIKVVHMNMPAIGNDAVTYTFTYNTLTDVVTRTVSAAVTHTLTVTYTDASKVKIATSALVAA